MMLGRGYQVTCTGTPLLIIVFGSKGANMGLLSGSTQQDGSLDLEKSGLVEESSNLRESSRSLLQPSNQSYVVCLLAHISIQGGGGRFQYGTERESEGVSRPLLAINELRRPLGGNKVSGNDTFLDVIT